MTLQERNLRRRPSRSVMAAGEERRRSCRALRCVALWTLLVIGAVAHPTIPALSDTTPAPHVVNCGHREMLCLSENKLSDSLQNCFTPLERGPCVDGHWFTLDMESDSLEGLCRLRPCVSDLLPFEGRCLNEGEARIQVCTGGHVHLDASGIPRCGQFPGWRQAIESSALCFQDPELTTAIAVEKVKCAENNSGDCVKHVKAVTPKPNIRPED